MRILSLLGSPRANGTTHSMARLIAGGLSGGGPVEEIALQEKHIRPCRGCQSCDAAPHVCPLARTDDAEAGFAAIAAMIPLLWKFVLHDYQKNRILAPYDSSIDPTNTGINWQPHQSKIALASGQWTGAGLGHGTQSQSNALAGKHTDFIYAVIGEELGMIACILVIMLLLIIIIRCVMVGIRSGSNMGSLVCFGVAAFLTFQTFENIGMCIGITPVIGITLPFFSYGGSSLFTTFAALGMVSGIHFRPRPKRNSIYY